MPRWDVPSVDWTSFRRDLPVALMLRRLPVTIVWIHTSCYRFRFLDE